MDNLNENLNETELGSHPFITWNPKYSYPPTAIHVKIIINCKPLSLKDKKTLIGTTFQIIKPILKCETSLIRAKTKKTEKNQIK